MMKNDELASLGIRAYQCGEYQMAVEFLTELCTRDPKLWNCRLYLAMAHQYAGDTRSACDELKTISEWSTDHSVRRKALEALRALRSLKAKQPVRSH